MDGLMFMLLGFLICLIAIIMLCLDSLRKTGLYTLLVGIFFIFIGAYRCSSAPDFIGNRRSDEDIKSCQEYYEEWSVHVKQNDLAFNDSCFIAETTALKSKVSGAEMTNAQKNADNYNGVLTPLLKAFYDKVKKNRFPEVNGMDQEKLRSGNWSVKIYLVTKVTPELFCVESSFSNDSIYIGSITFVDIKKRVIAVHQSSLSTIKNELTEPDCEDYVNPRDLTAILSSSNGLRQDFWFWNTFEFNSSILFQDLKPDLANFIVRKDGKNLPAYCFQLDNQGFVPVPVVQL